MKLRLPLLAVCGLLLVTAAAFAAPDPSAPAPSAAAVTATASTPPAPTSPASVAAAPSALAAPAGPKMPDPQNGCATTLSGARISGVTPSPTPLYGGPTCGSCSTDGCSGAPYNAICGFQGGQFGQCLNPLGIGTCGDGNLQCQCWFGPLP